MSEEQTAKARPLKKKLHLNWNKDRLMWEVKKSFGYKPHLKEWTDEALTQYLQANSEIDVVLRYV